MLISINAHLLSGQAGYRQAGIHHYIKESLRHLPKPDNWRYQIEVGRNCAVDVGHPLHNSRWDTENRLRRIAWEQTTWPRVASAADLLHSFAFVTPVATRKPCIVTVYDLSFMHYPDAFPRGQRAYLQTQTRRSSRSARRIITISESGKQDVHRFFGVPTDQIDVVYPAVDEQYRVLDKAEIEQFKQAQQLPDRFILHVGTLQPRKNIERLIEALPLLDRSLHLVLVGGKGWLYDAIYARIGQLGLRERVHFTGYVPDEDLPRYYNAATIVAIPSIYEGFGFPVVEAMACGTPVVASQASSLPEAGGDAARYFDPHSAEAIAERIESVVGNSAESATMRQRGLVQASKFQWTQAGHQLLSSYRKGLGLGT